MPERTARGVCSQYHNEGEVGLPVYQVYVPSPRTLSQASLVSHPSLSAQPSYSNGQPSWPGPPSTAQTSLRSNGYPSLQHTHQRSNLQAAAAPRSNLQVYSQLQLPSTSNWGSMKRGAKRGGAKEAGPTSLAPGMLSPASLPDLNNEAPYSVQYMPHIIPVHNNNKPTKV